MRLGCYECRHFESTHDELGECRRFAPDIRWHYGPGGVPVRDECDGYWPVVYGTEWCGEHRLSLTGLLRSAWDLARSAVAHFGSPSSRKERDNAR